MQNMLQRVLWQAYAVVHSNGLLADWLYAGAFHFQNFSRKIYFARVQRENILPVEIQELRSFKYTNGLNAGVTNICNAKCTFCAYPKVVANKTLQTGVMSFDIFKKAVDELVALGKDGMDLTPVVGDPLVDGGLLEKLDYAIRQAGMKNVTFTTNGILLDKNDNYQRLIDSGISGIFISAPGTSRQTYEEVYGVNRYDEFLSGVCHLLEYNRTKGEPVRIVIRFRNAQKPSQIIRSSDFQKYIKPFLSANVRINFTVDFDNWGGTIRSEDMRGVMRLRQLPAQINVPCRALFGFALRHDGNVRLCGCRLQKNDFDDLVVGSIKENSLLEISQNDKTWEIIQGFYHGQRPQVCKDCTIYAPIDRKWLKNRSHA